ncbi:MAG: pyridoxal kinase [Hyphomonadaceae bacterium]
MKTILTIQSQVAGARVGNSIAAFAIERLGVGAIALPTTLYGRRPDRGAPGGEAVSADLLRGMLAGLDADGRLKNVDAVLSGYLANAEQADFVLEAVDKVKAQNTDAIYMCDPVMGDEGGAYVKDATADAIVEGLVRQADWIAPNAWEMGRISGRPCTDLETARTAARRLGKPCLISSLPTENGIGVLYAAPTGDWLAETAILPAAPKGTGDLLTALFLARRVLGQAPAVSLEAAMGAVYDVAVRSIAAGSDDLVLPDAQDLLETPRTWPRATSLGT